MARKTQITWTHRKHAGQTHPGGTANFWIGCTPIDPACAGCYAWAQDNRHNWTPEGWGKGKPRYQTKGGAANARSIHRASIKAGFPLACFTNSMSDFFDEEVPDEWRHAAFDVIRKCHAADFLILTKRHEKMQAYMSERYPNPLPNVWLGVTAATQASADARVGALLATPARRRFISAEPLLEAVKFPLGATYVCRNGHAEYAPDVIELHAWNTCQKCGAPGVFPRKTGGIDWIIVGGESEDINHPHRARPMAPEWAKDIRRDCWEHGVPFFFKQWGEWAPIDAVNDPQAKAMIEKGDVVATATPGGHWPVYKVGKTLSRATLAGQASEEMPPFHRDIGQPA